MVKEGYLYSEDHEWVRVEEGKAYIGITDYAQNELGDIVFVELPELEATVSAGDQVGVLESVKAVADVFCPVSGTVVEVNQGLEDEPELLISEPFEQHIFVVELDGELPALMDAAAYEAFLAE